MAVEYLVIGHSIFDASINVSLLDTVSDDTFFGLFLFLLSAPSTGDGVLGLS